MAALLSFFFVLDSLTRVWAVRVWGSDFLKVLRRWCPLLFLFQSAEIRGVFFRDAGEEMESFVRGRISRPAFLSEVS